MSRRYIDPVRVRTDLRRTPVQFIWRGRTYLVCAVLAHWIEGVAWWRRSDPDGRAGGHSGDREVWRVEARPRRSVGVPGVYDLCCDPPERWHLARAFD